MRDDSDKRTCVYARELAANYIYIYVRRKSKGRRETFCVCVSVIGIYTTLARVERIYELPPVDRFACARVRGNFRHRIYSGEGRSRNEAPAVLT